MRFILAIALLALTVAALAWLWFVKLPADRLLQSKMNIGELDLAITRYTVAHDGVCASTIGEVIEAGYLVTLPANPLARDQRAMREVPLGQHSAGDFTYVPVYADDPSRPVAGKLILYGPKPLPSSGEQDWGLSEEIERSIAKEYVVLVIETGTSWKGMPALK